MRRALIYVSVLLTASPAMATRARLRALNQDGNGSFYLIDARNIYLNPAQINQVKENASFEWGRRERPGVGAASAEAEGGAVVDMNGGAKLGLNLGRVTEFSQFVRRVNERIADATSATMGGNFPEGQNSFDVTYGMRTASGQNIGLGGSLTRSKTATNTADQQTSVQALELRGGMQNERIDVFGSAILNGQSTSPINTTHAELKQNFGARVGAGFSLAADKRLYGSFRYGTLDMRRGDRTGDYTGEELDGLVGFTNFRPMPANSLFFYSVELAYYALTANDNNPAKNTEKYTELTVPVTIGIEAEANTWLRLKGSVRQGFMLGQKHTTSGSTTKDNNRWENSPNDTSVAGGANAVFNKFNFDFALVQSLGDDHGRVEGAMSYIF